MQFRKALALGVGLLAVGYLAVKEPEIYEIYQTSQRFDAVTASIKDVPLEQLVTTKMLENLSDSYYLSEGYIVRDIAYEHMCETLAVKYEGSLCQNLFYASQGSQAWKRYKNNDPWDEIDFEAKYEAHVLWDMGLWVWLIPQTWHFASELQHDIDAAFDTPEGLHRFYAAKKADILAAYNREHDVGDLRTSGQQKFAIRGQFEAIVHSVDRYLNPATRSETIASTGWYDHLIHERFRVGGEPLLLAYKEVALDLLNSLPAPPPELETAKQN